MTIKELRKKYYGKIDSFDFDILSSFVLGKTREFILSYPEKKLTKNQVEKLILLIKKRKRNEPLAYLLGFKEFFGNKFIVNQNVLVPRPETELMIEETIKLATQNPQNKTIIDIGTGSGCIIISLAKELGEKNNYIGVDISLKALLVAKKNAKLNRVNKYIKFKKSNLLLDLPKSIFSNQESQITICANLPYLSPEQIKNSPSIKKEPRLALVAGWDGLKYYKKLFKQILKFKKENPSLNFTILCEIDNSQRVSIKKLTKDEFKINYTLEIKKDLRNKNRLVVINY